MKETGRSGELIATNDELIASLLADDRYRVYPNGTIETLITETGKTSVQGIWRVAGSLSKEGYRVIKYNHSCLSVHRIIFAKFGAEPLQRDLIVNHIDGKRNNNAIENLEQVPQGGNNLHRFRVLGHPAVIGNKKISYEIADQIRADHANGMSYKYLCEKYGMSKSSISGIINNKNWVRKKRWKHVIF